MKFRIKTKIKRRPRSKAVKIKLNQRDISFLKNFLGKGSQKSRALKRANVLLLAHQKKKDGEISKLLHISGKSIWAIKKRYLTEGLNAALEEKPRPGQPIKYDDVKKAEIIAVSCTTPPVGRDHWSIRMLVEEFKRKKGFKNINREVVRLILKKAKQNPG